MPTAAQLRPALSKPVEPRLPLPGTTPEFELLLACCALPHNGGWDDRMENILALPCDWKRFIALAEHHRIVPLVYRCLAHYSNRLPVRDFTLLRSIYEENALRALWFTGELVRILKHLESKGIRAMPYKGPALAQALYRDVTARQFSDLDILVCPEDLRNAKAALAKLGYKPTIELRASLERAYISTGCGYSFDGRLGPQFLDLQWRIVPRFYAIEFDLAAFFERTEQVVLGGHSFSTLSVDDLLVVLCVHAAKHLWVQLSWLCDIAEVAGSPRIDWDAVWQRSRQLGLQRIFAINVLLIQDLLGLPLPSPIESWLKKDRSSEILRGEVLQIIRRSSHYDTESAAYFRLMMRLRERWLDKSLFLWRLIWTPSVSEWSAIQLPEGLFPLYRGIRLFRLAKRFANRR
jgi:hypothetical protein